MPCTPEERDFLGRFVSDPDGGVFAVKPGAMPGMVGAVFARYSRTRGGFRDVLLREFIREGNLDAAHADELIERILIAFGDDSVQELESAWLAFEGVSNLATKVVEDRRLGAFIEQSSRYVFYDERDVGGRYRYLREPTIMASPLADRFVAVMDFLFETYCRLIPLMQTYYERRKRLEEAEYEIRRGQGKIRFADCTSEEERRDFRLTYKMDIRTKTCDTLRILLPACTLTNVGVHANGRTFEHLLRHLFSHELPELQGLGVEAKAALDTVIPRYVQRAGPSDWIISARRRMRLMAEGLLNRGHAPDVLRGARLLEGGYSASGEAAAMLFTEAEHSYTQILAALQSQPHLVGLVRQSYLAERKNRREHSGRSLEFGHRWLVEFVIDFGIFRDLHRHRMLMQMRQALTTRLGYCTIPEEIVEAGYADDVRGCFERADELYEAVRAELGRFVAQYVVPFGFNIRALFGLSNREAQHLLELRTIPQGHRSYRLVCQDLYRQMCAVDPSVALLCPFVDLNDYDWPRGDSEARQRAREAEAGRETQ
jgi:thymidylate synthase ThyX